MWPRYTDVNAMLNFVCLTGFFMLPVKLLSEAPQSSLVREKDTTFIERLKTEMLENPISDVQPILCLVDLPEGDVFEPALKEAYSYKSIGGNHSREALQQLLQENPSLKENKINQAIAVGKLIAKNAKEKGIDSVVFDRGGFLYHGRIKALAESARDSGLKF